MAADDAEWGRLAGRLVIRNLTADPRFATLAARKANEKQLDDLIIAWTVTGGGRGGGFSCRAAGVAAAVVADNRYLDEEDPHINQRGYFVELDHPEAGVRKHCGIPWKMSRTECAVRAPAPCLGQHTDEILSQLLGYSPGEIEKLRGQGALE